MKTAKNLYETMGKGEILQSFSGLIQQSVIDDLLPQAEKKIKSKVSNRILEKKVFSLYIECLQNLFHHISKDCVVCKQEASILLTKENEKFNILTSNYIENNRVNLISDQIDSLNAMSLEKIKQLYLNSLTNTGFSEKGGGGLGLIDMIRKSKNKIEYNIEKLDNDFSALNLKVVI